MPYPFDPAPVTLWTLTRDAKLASCEIAFVPTGVEARIMRNGKRLYARTFPTEDEALEWAEEERTKLLSNGWGAAILAGIEQGVRISGAKLCSQLRDLAN